MIKSYGSRMGGRMVHDASAEQFVKRLGDLVSPAEATKLRRYFKTGRGQYAEGDVFIGVRMGDLFNLAKEFIDMPPDEISILLDSPVHEARAGGLSIMGKQASRKKTPASRREELYELFLRRIDRINSWDLVDLSSHHVVGSYLYDKPRDVLYELARSDRWWERRIAIFSTMYFVRQGDLEDTFRLAAILAHDEHDLIHKVVGGMVREAGKRDRDRLRRFLDEYAPTAPRVMLRYAIEHLDPTERAHYLAMKSAK